MGALRFLTVSEKMGWTWVIFPDTVNFDNHVLIERELQAIVTGTRQRIAIDLGKSEHLYSSAIGLLIRFRNNVCESGGIVCLVNLSQKIRDLLTSVNLDKLVSMYSTDVEFEISQGDVWERKISEEKPMFIAIAQVEKDACRIFLSGNMTGLNDLSGFNMSVCRENIRRYIFDLSSLESIDSIGVGLLIRVLDGIKKIGGKAAAYGACDAVADVISLASADEFIVLCDAEADALKAVEN